MGPVVWLKCRLYVDAMPLGGTPVKHDDRTSMMMSLYTFAATSGCV